MKALEIVNLRFGYNKSVFDKFNFCVEKGSFMTVIGSSGCGKSALFKILNSSVDYFGTVKYFNKSFEFAVRKGYVGFVSIDSNYIDGLVVDSYVEVLKRKGRSIDKIREELNRVCKKLKLDGLLNCYYNELCISEKIKVLIGYQLLYKPRLLVLDDVLEYLGTDKKDIIRELIRFNKRCTIINITNDTEDVMIGKDVFVFNDGYYKKKDLNVNIFISNNLKVPFLLDLSDKLNDYGLVDRYYFDIEELVDYLWG